METPASSPVRPPVPSPSKAPSTSIQDHQDAKEQDDQGKARKKSSYAKTFDGTVFKIPETHNMISSLFDPRLPKSHLDLITLSTLIIQVIPLIIFPRQKLRPIYLIWFLFWRLTYNVGLGWILKKQSENKFLIKLIHHFNLFNSKFNPRLSNWIENQLKSKMSTNNLNYDLNQFPIEFNVWLLFRQLVDIILLNDFLSYFCLSYCSLKLPNQQQQQQQPSQVGHQPNLSVYLIRWSIGILLVGFNIWVKLDAHRIVHDFAWYWGDAFFLSLQDLVFDGVFEMAPHPMYSIGYAGFYGASLITGSRSVFFVSLFAHLCQFGFLVYFENPHIQRTYGPQARPLTAPRSRSPLRSRSLTNRTHRPSNLNPTSDQNLHSPLVDQHQHTSLNESNHHEEPSSKQPIDPIEIREQLEHKLFSRKDMILISNYDKFKSIDFATVLVIGYNLLILLIRDETVDGQKKGYRTGLWISCLNAIGWRIWFSFGLGFRLKQQSTNKMMVRHFLTKYYYPIRNYRHPQQQQQQTVESELNQQGENDLMDELKFEVIEESFHNWKGIYNLSLMMTYVSFAIMSIKFYKLQDQWDISAELIRITFGLCLVGIHIWTAISTYEVLGKFGWFYGDFFADDYPVELTYGGIYRYLNNPERSMGGAGFIGMSLMSGNKFVFALALCSMLSHWWFLSSVETPHMKKIYGDRIRKEAGLTKVLKQNARKLKSRTKTLDIRLDRDSGGAGASLGGRSEEKGDGKGFEQRFKEVQGTFEFIYDETVQALDEFLEKSAPRLSGVVRDTKVLLQSSGQRLILTRVTNDLSSYDTTQYRLSMKESSYHPTRDAETKRLRFHMGEPITIEWSSPWNHSRADWIGCYKRGSNKSGLVTEVASSGRWSGLFQDEWEGDIHIGKNNDDHLDPKSPLNPTHNSLEKSPKNGTLVFNGDRLPREEGTYEFRFHHDGKYNVMAITEPFEIYVERIGQDVENMKEVEDKLRKLIGYGLGMEENLIPKKLKREITRSKYNNDDTEGGEKEEEGDGEEGEEDRFTVMSLEEARRIQRLISIGIGIELGIEIIIEDCEICRLAKRIVFVKSLLKPFLNK